MKFVESVAFPPLAKRFQARIVGNDIVVRAHEPFLRYPRTSELTDPLHDLLGGYAERIAHARGWGKRPPHVAFLNVSRANNLPNALVDFVRTFGWIDVPPKRLRYVVRRTGHTGVWLARQDLTDAARECGRFCALARLLTALQSEGSVLRFTDVVASWFEPARRLYRGLGTARPVRLAHAMLAEILNAYPPQLVPGAGGVFELPALEASGLKAFLYHALRRDYLAAFGPARRPSLGYCRRPQCQQFFVIERLHQVYCSPLCSRLHRQLLRWHEKRAGHRPALNEEVADQ